MIERPVFLDDMDWPVSHKVSETGADLDKRLLEVERILQIQQEQIEIINTIFQKVFGGIDVESIKVAGDEPPEGIENSAEA
jgi:hypothetical protein